MEIKRGLLPDMAGIALLRELVRGDVARELTHSGRIINGDEAVRLGLATWAGSDPLAHAREMTRNIARRSPDAIRAAKRLLNRSADGDAAALLASKSREQNRLMASPNQLEAVRALPTRRNSRPLRGVPRTGYTLTRRVSNSTRCSRDDS
jgi:enoyl-CoA hydratase/carnithine racemase